MAEVGRAAVDPSEISKFNAMAETWWDPHGPHAPLHRMQPVRLSFLTAQLCAHFARDPSDRAPLTGLRGVDIGCGAGLITEPLARLGAEMIGVDHAADALSAARAHASALGVAVEYRQADAADLPAGAFDFATVFEVVEHAPEPSAFVAACARLVRPGGLFLISTLNRTAQSWALAIVGAEYVLGWTPRGTHRWSRFQTPDEIDGYARAGELRRVASTGVVFAPLRDQWRLARDMSVNYVLAFEKDPQAGRGGERRAREAEGEGERP